MFHLYLLMLSGLRESLPPPVLPEQREQKAPPEQREPLALQEAPVQQVPQLQVQPPVLPVQVQQASVVHS